MTPRQRIFAVLIGIFIPVLVVELVRRRKLREEYSWLWILVGFIVFVLAVWFDLLVFISI